ncbi:MAG TPA: hypothetical protein VFS33_11025, partial [Gemmatimonadales bacterium]|nr:hypothetical protein [Gemmatimonadales bacterium]
MLWTRTAIGLGLIGLVACSRGEKKQSTATADSLQRDLQLAPVDTGKPLADQPADTAAPPPAAREPAHKPAGTPKPKPAPRR